jgi:hypothetical protein
MPFDLKLPLDLKQAGWKVKIHEGERLEEPHVTIIRKTEKWRLSLRTGQFLDRGHKWSQISNGIRDVIQKEWARLGTEWDAKYPVNPIQSHDDNQNN